MSNSWPEHRRNLNFNILNSHTPAGLQSSISNSLTMDYGNDWVRVMTLTGVNTPAHIYAEYKLLGTKYHSNFLRILRFASAVGMTVTLSWESTSSAITNPNLVRPPNYPVSVFALQSIERGGITDPTLSSYHWDAPLLSDFRIGVDGAVSYDGVIPANIFFQQHFAASDCNNIPISKYIGGSYLAGGERLLIDFTLDTPANETIVLTAEWSDYDNENSVA